MIDFTLEGEIVNLMDIPYCTKWPLNLLRLNTFSLVAKSPNEYEQIKEIARTKCVTKRKK